MMKEKKLSVNKNSIKAMSCKSYAIKELYIMCAVVKISSHVKFNMVSTLTKVYSKQKLEGNRHVTTIIHCQHATVFKSYWSFLDQLFK